MSGERCGSVTGARNHTRDGTPTTEDCGCRGAVAERQRKYREMRRLLDGGPMLVDPEPTHRRMRALARIGWSFGAQAEMLGLSHRNSAQRILAHTKVHRDTAGTIADLFERLHMTPGPSAETRRRAEKANWSAPLDWDDIDDLDEVPFNLQPEQLEERRRKEERARWEKRSYANRRARLAADPEYRQKLRAQATESQRRTRARRAAEQRGAA